MSKFIRSTFLVLNLVLVCFTFFSYLSPSTDPSNIYFFSFFGLLYPFFLLLNVAFIIVWLFSKKRFALISFVTILLGYSFTSSFINFSSSTKSSLQEKGLNILSYNVQSLKDIRKKNGTLKESLKDEFLKPIQNSEIICTQETSHMGYHLIKDELNLKNHLRSKQWGAAIFTTYPIIDSGEIDLQSDLGSSAIWADIKIDSSIVRVYNLHLRSNKISKPTEEMMEDPDLQSSKTWKSIRGILANYKNSTIHRSKQAKTIEKHIANSPNQVIICGDFNDTPLSYVYKTLTKNKLDSFKQRGSGIGTTYAGIIPALRIDYILTDERLEIVRHSVLKENYSDHYPISVEIVSP